MNGMMLLEKPKWRKILANISDVWNAYPTHQEVLEVENPPRHHPIKPRWSQEEEVPDDVSITKSLVGNHQLRGRTRAVKISSI